MSPSNPVEPGFGQIVRDRRTQKGLTLRKFAQMIGLSPSYISLMERGEENPPGEANIRQIALVLDLNEDFLLAEAGKVSSDLKNLIMERPSIMAEFLRTTKGRSDEELLRFTKDLKSKLSQSPKPEEPHP